MTVILLFGYSQYTDQNSLIWSKGSVLLKFKTDVITTYGQHGQVVPLHVAEALFLPFGQPSPLRLGKVPSDAIKTLLGCNHIIISHRYTIKQQRLCECVCDCVSMMPEHAICSAKLLLSKSALTGDLFSLLYFTYFIRGTHLWMYVL